MVAAGGVWVVKTCKRLGHAGKHKGLIDGLAEPAIRRRIRADSSFRDRDSNFPVFHEKVRGFDTIHRFGPRENTLSLGQLPGFTVNARLQTLVLGFSLGFVG